ncbi:MAG: S8 family serine peptidase, partial [Bdellovibrionales bacterium]|nr:S8 family serine peptidase [Bdellovibrionales bacterium]
VALKDTILELGDAGVLVIAAAGNSGLNIDLYPNFPASFNTENIIAVAASTSRNLMADFSNYSVNQVHVAAPGKDIYSTVPSDSHAFYSGTSMAAPQVSGLAALIWSARPDLTMSEVKEAIIAGSEGEYYPVISRGEVDVKHSLESLGL